jgi:TRAP-type C4-dicarboxylate transport system permease small subunit
MEKETTEQATKSLFKEPLELVLSLILVAIVGVTFIQVLFRYIFHLSLAWSEELARYLFLWLAALASAYAFKTKSHIALTFLVDRLGGRVRGWADTIAVLIVSGFLILFVWKSLEFSISMAKQIAPSTKISMAVPYSSAWVGGVLMLYFVLRNWRSDRQAKKQGKSSPGRKWD